MPPTAVGMLCSSMIVSNPSLRSAFTAFGHSVMPAPTSFSSCARSNTRMAYPACRSAMASVSPPLRPHRRPRRSPHVDSENLADKRNIEDSKTVRARAQPTRERQVESFLQISLCLGIFPGASYDGSEPLLRAEKEYIRAER